jgi:di/tripeptidase
MKIPTMSDAYPKYVQQRTERTRSQGQSEQPAPSSEQTALVNRDEVKDLFLELTTIPGRSFHERKVADTITAKAKALGYEVKEDGAAEKIGGNSGNLLIDVPGTIPDAPGLIFLAHMDTVALAEGVRPKIRDGVIYSDGFHALGGDDRAGDAELLTVMKTIKEKNLPHPHLQFIFTVAEEAGLVGSKALDPKDVHGRLGFEADFFRPNEVLWGSEWDENGPIPGPPHPRNSEETMLENFTLKSITDIGLKPEKYDIPDASSDSASLRQMGIPALIIGAGEQDVHTRHEHIAVEDLGKATELVLQIIENANQLKVDEQGQIVSRQVA